MADNKKDDPIVKAMKIMDKQSGNLSAEARKALGDTLGAAQKLTEEAKNLKDQALSKKKDVEAKVRELSRLVKRSKAELDAKAKSEKAAEKARKAVERTTAPKPVKVPKAAAGIQGKSGTDAVKPAVPPAGTKQGSLL